MDWTAIKAGLKSLVAQVSGLSEAGVVEWSDSPESATWRPSPRVTLSARSVVGRGQDGVRISSPDDNGDRTATLVGARSFTLVVKVESDDAVNADAKIYADRVRVRLKRKASLSALRGLGLAFVHVESTVDQELVTQGRKLSVCVTDIRLNAAENDVDTTPGAAGVFDAAHIESDTLQDAAGNDLVPQVEVDVTREDG